VVIGRVVVVVTGAAFLVVMATASVRSTAALDSPGSFSAHMATYRQSQCLTAEAHREELRDAEVLIENSTDTYAGQLVTQYLTGWAVPTTAPGRARWTVELVAGRGGCDGEHLLVRRL
jgi:hypothetical protein